MWKCFIYCILLIKHVTMKSVYYDPSHPASFGGVRRLKDATGRNDVESWLASQPTYTLHKPIRHKFPRLKTYITTKGEQYQADLVDVSSLAKSNRGVKFLLTCIDVFSRYAWVKPLKTKKGRDVTNAFKKIFRDGVPMKLQTDKGKEFLNIEFQKYLKSKGVEFFTTNSETKASLVERFNRTIKERAWRYMTYKDTRKYIDVLPKIVQAYNGAKHTVTGVAPKDVNDSNESAIWKRLYGKRNQNVRPKYSVGDTVRVQKQKTTFEKGFTPKWTEEIFTVSRVNTFDKPTYVIKDAEGEEIQGRFYEQELQKVVDTGIYAIEKVLARRKGKIFVKWRGYPVSMASWIPTNDG